MDWTQKLKELIEQHKDMEISKEEFEKEVDKLSEVVPGLERRKKESEDKDN